MRDRRLFIASVCYLLLFFLAVLAVFSPMKRVFLPFVTAAMLCYFLSPLVKLLERFKIKRRLAAGIVYLSIALFLFAVIFYFAPKLYGAVLNASEELVKLLSHYGLNFLNKDYLYEKAESFYDVGAGALHVGAAFAVGAAAAFYILADKNVKCVVKEAVPPELMSSFCILAGDVKEAFDSFFRGQVSVALVLALMDAAFLCFLKIPYAWALGLLGGALDIIPYIGAFTAFFIYALITLYAAPQKIIWLAIGFLIIQQIENNVISPKIVGGETLHPAAVILILYLGSFGGFWGILLSVPLASCFVKISSRLFEAII